MSDLVYYAIGDIHGEVEKLDLLLDYIREDAARRSLDYKIILLGDLIDRGADSRGVVARAMALTESGEAAAIKGNHEELMLHAYEKTESVGVFFWAENGGDQTIRSYKRVNGDTDDWRDAIDRTHIEWLLAQPAMIRDEERGLVFVHGGIDPQTFPHCSDEVRMWTRSNKFFDAHRWPARLELEGLLVVHGHTPTSDFEPYAGTHRINVDTGACFGGPLTSVVLTSGEQPRFLRA